LANSLTIKSFSTFLGLDLASSDLIRQPQYSSGAQNTDNSKTGALSKRLGYQYITPSTGGLGMGVYNNIDVVTGAVTEQLINVDSNLYTLVDDAFTVVYAGTNTSLLTIKADPTSGNFTLTLVENATTVLTQNLKFGINESSHTAISAVITAINSIAGYTATSGALSTQSAAFIYLQNQVVLSTTPYAVKYRRWSLANYSKVDLLSGLKAARDNSDFENASFASMNGNLYISSGYDGLFKYDGQTFYKAGLPQPASVPVAVDSATGTSHPSGNTFYYFYTYQQTDAKGNLIESVPSGYSTLHTMAATKDVNVTVADILDTTGFNTHAASVNGAQSSVTTITVTTGHTLAVGDQAYFYDSISAAYITRTVTARAATTVTVSGAAVTVATGIIISNGLVINLYRTANAPVNALTALYSLVKTVPNNPFSSTQVILDDVSDANLGFNYVAPQVAHGLPPIGRYLTTFKNQLFISGVSTDVNNVFYSGLNSPEYFPPGGNAFLVDAFQGSKVRGLGSLHTAVIVFKDVSIQAVTGDIGADNFAVNEISYGGIGCMAHASIQKLNGALYFLSRTGIYTVDITNGVVPKGKKIQSEFTKASVAFNLQKAVAGSWLRENKYLLFMPVEGTDGSGHKYADKTTSYVYVHDYKWDAWHKWTNINAQGGFAYSDTMNLMYFTSRRLDTQSLTTTFESAIFNTYGNRNDYSDHNEAINWSYAINWIDLGDPAVYKKFLRCRFFTLPSDVLSGDASLYSMTVQQEIDYMGCRFYWRRKRL
jgi:hypothetical protein